jgi:hypothetical protein
MKNEGVALPLTHTSSWHGTKLFRHRINVPLTFILVYFKGLYENFYVFVKYFDRFR